ncbi:hypothetical protein J3R83DRAFT_10884, partial [Lanmaoa asiatica]
IVDFPSSATFLTPEEHAYLIWRKKYDNSTIGEEERFALSYRPSSDWQVYLHLLVYMSTAGVLVLNSLLSHHTSSHVGFSVNLLMLDNSHIYLAFVLLIWVHCSDKLETRSAFIYAGLLLLLIGYFIHISEASNNVKYFGTILIITGSYTSFPGVVSGYHLGNNLAGQYKRAVGMMFHISFRNFSGAIAANICRLQDSPRFILGHALELMFVGIGLIVVPILVVLYKHLNHARDEALRPRIKRREKLQLSIQELKDLGDHTPDFRYTL